MIAEGTYIPHSREYGNPSSFTIRYDRLVDERGAGVRSCFVHGPVTAGLAISEPGVRLGPGGRTETPPRQWPCTKQDLNIPLGFSSGDGIDHLLNGVMDGLGLEEGFWGTDLVVAVVFGHRPDHADQVSAQRPEGLVVLLTLHPFAVVVRLGLGDLLDVAGQGEHEGRLSAAVDLVGAAGTRHLAGLVVEAAHADVQGQARLAREAGHGTDLARQAGARGEAEARDGVDEASQLGVLGQPGTRRIQRVNLGQQIEDPAGIGHDHRPHVGHLGGEVGVALPALDHACVLLADATDLQEGGLVEAGQLRQIVAEAEEAQEPQVVDRAGDVRQARADGVQVGLHPVEHPDLLVHQHPPAPGKPLELSVHLRRHLHFAQDPLGDGHLVVQGEQLQDLAGVDRVALGRPGEDLLVAGQLQVVDVEQPPTASQDLLVQGSRVAVVALHGHGNRQDPPLGVGLHGVEEGRKALRGVVDVELLGQGLVRDADGHTVAVDTDIDGHQDVRISHGRTSFWGEVGESSHVAPPAVTSTLRATGWHHPGRRKGGQQRRGRHFRAEQPLARCGPHEPHPRPCSAYKDACIPQPRGLSERGGRTKFTGAHVVGSESSGELGLWLKELQGGAPELLVPVGAAPRSQARSGCGRRRRRRGVQGLSASSRWGDHPPAQQGAHTGDRDASSDIIRR